VTTDESYFYKIFFLFHNCFGDAIFNPPPPKKTIKISEFFVFFGENMKIKNIWVGVKTWADTDENLEIFLLYLTEIIYYVDKSRF
jgi:hypothetical protein